mmetsp:Transcript_170435/g.541441  ORF Transcript_170435/g.541441 Transcript_170435/m.541441 type:complete len:91 (-) Transcript_170435:99-371(-)
MLPTGTTALSSLHASARFNPPDASSATQSLPKAGIDSTCSQDAIGALCAIDTKCFTAQQLANISWAIAQKIVHHNPLLKSTASALLSMCS